MIGGLVAIAIAVWFFTSAQKLPGRDPIQWGAVGVVVYYLTVALWSVVSDLGFLADFHHRSVAIGAFMHYLGVALGVLAAWLVKRRWLKA